jgi:flavodoxin
MKVGIIVHSHTGNTLSVAEKLKDAIAAKGHTVIIERVSAVNEDPSAQGPVTLKDIPDVSSYDALVFGAPVRAFSLTPTMQAYVAQLQALKGKKAGFFVTKQLPFAWTGGNRAVGQMKNACEAKGAVTYSTGVISWGSKKREEIITKVLKNLSEL